jgi:diguanylate cyclase (GGDEF)-like protein
VGPDGRVCEASPGASALIARPRAAILQRTLPELVDPLDFETTTVRLRDGRLQVTLRALPDLRLPDLWAFARDGNGGTAPPDPYRDPLTGLTSPLLVPDRLSVAVAQAYRQRARVGVVHVDLDRFASVTERLGRPIADRLMRAVARRLARCVRSGDTAARGEGDAFLLVLPGLQHAEDATRVAEKVLGALRRPFPLPEGPVSLTASLGVAVFPEDGESAVALLASASSAARRARGHGGDRLEPGEAAAPGGADPFELEAGLRAALAGCAVEIDGATPPAGLLYYQPIRATSDGRIVGVEALLRWQHPQLGLVFPRTFLSKADFTGLILAIGPWILRTAARQGRGWQQAQEKLRVAVNLSAHELMRRGLADEVREVLLETGLPPRRLQLEVPDGQVLSDLPRSLDALHRLKDLGVTLVLDRVAVRYSSLGRLAELPLDGVKLDLAFLRGHGSRAEDASLLSALAAGARGLKLRVAAQGVETADQLALLARLGCSEAQGFHLGAPMPPARFAAQLEGAPGAPATGARA